MKFVEVNVMQGSRAEAEAVERWMFPSPHLKVKAGADNVLKLPEPKKSWRKRLARWNWHEYPY